MVKEHENLSDLPELRAELEPWKNLIVREAIYTGYITVIEIGPFVARAEQMEAYLEFIDILILRMRAFGDLIPVEYLKSLPGGQGLLETAMDGR